MSWEPLDKIRQKIILPPLPPPPELEPEPARVQIKKPALAPRLRPVCPRCGGRH
jgi:hypothetical protein